MSGDESTKHIPTVSYTSSDTVIELVYDQGKRDTGLIVSRFGGLWNREKAVRVETGDILAPYSPRNNLIANDCVLLPSAPVDFGNKKELLDDIAAYLHRYVDLTPLFEQIAAHYILMTWVYDAFGEVPYLRLRGDYGTGKTRALIAIGSACYKPFFASGASTVSPIFHTLDAFGGTLLLDEADFRFSDQTSEIIKILNNGNVRGLPVLRTIINRNREFNPQAFKVFGPKIIAMRGSFDDKALESRFLTEDMGLTTLRPDIPIQLPKELKKDALALRNRLLHYRLCNFFTIKTDTSHVSPDIEPRFNQTALSLMSVIDDPDLRAALSADLSRRSNDALGERRDTVEGRVAIALVDAFGTEAGASVPLGIVADRFNDRFCSEYGRSFSNKWIGRVVRARFRIETQKSHGIYVIPATEKPKIDALALKFGIGANGAG